MSETAFTEFMRSTMDSLSKLLNAPEGTLLFSPGESRPGNYHRAIPIGGGVFSVSLGSPEDGKELVLREAVEVVGKALTDASVHLRPDTDGPHFFPAGGASWHTPETLAEQFASRITGRIFSWVENTTGIHLPYVSLLAGMFYESDESVGTLAFWDSPPPPDVFERVVRPILLPEAPVTLERGCLKAIRKHFAGVGDGGLLFIRENGTYVLRGYVRKEYLPQMPVAVKIQGRENWRMLFNGKCVFGAKGSQAYCLKSMLQFNIELLKQELGEAEVAALEPAIRAVSCQKHGSSIIFLDLEQAAAREKMEALARNGRALRVQGLGLTGPLADEEAVFALLKNLARVDGALVIDYPRGAVAYVDAILDGDSIVAGDAAAGARRNAVSCFIANLAIRSAKARSLKAAAMVFSENGEIRLARASEYRAKEAGAVRRQKAWRMKAAGRNKHREMWKNTRKG